MTKVPEFPLLIALPKDQFVSRPLKELRNRLIERFVSQQKVECEYLLLTANHGPDQQVPHSLVVAEQWGMLRQGTGTIPDEVQKAEINLMYAVEVGEFPGLLMISEWRSVELLNCFKPGLVDELAADIGREHQIKFDPWCESENTALMPSEKRANMRPQYYGLPPTDDRIVVGPWRGLLWAPRDEVVKFLEGRGVNTQLLPSSWRTRTDQEDDPPSWCDYPDESTITGPQPKIALEMLKCRYPDRYPDHEEGKLLGIVNAEYAKRHPPGRRKRNARGDEITELKLHDLKRGLGRKA